MNSQSLKIRRFLLSRVIRKACGSSIPRSGREGERVNCFITSVDKEEDEPYLVVLGVHLNKLECLEWDGVRYSIQKSISLAAFRLSDFRITHFYGLDEIRYQGITDFVIGRVTGWPYIKVHVIRWLGGLGQYIFNKKKLITKQRIELLQFLVVRALDGVIEHEPIDLMADLYTIRWLFHPQGEQQQQKLEFYLKSLVETGELKYTNDRYIVTGKALQTIEEYEEQERKHTESVKMQWRMFWLTLTIAALTLVQSGLVKLPAIIDLTSK